MRFEEEYMDVFQNIESAIVSVYRQHEELLDSDVEIVLNVLIKTYLAEKSQRPVNLSGLDELQRELYDAMHGMCEFRLGRQALTSPQGDEKSLVVPLAITVKELLKCLKRLRKSQQMWTKEGGMRGYLKFVDPFIA